MSDNKNKTFSICQVFNDLSNPTCVWMNGDAVKHFGVNWKIRLLKDFNGIYPCLACESSETGDWSINTVFDLIVGGKTFKTGSKSVFHRYSKRWDAVYIPKREFSDFRIGKSVTIEFHVKITGITGIEKKQKSMNFDDDVAKKSSDVVLVVGDQKFYVSKLLLTFRCTYFESLFSGNFSESQKSIIELKDIDPEYFQDFLEIIYGVSAVDDETVSEILKLTDFFDAKTAVKRCEDFLMNYSKKSLKEKFGMAIKYKMGNLKNKCLSEIQNSEDVRKIFPEVSDDHDNCIYKDLLEKSLSFK
ncbi:hypothetical protein B9Z55_007937 [Caenorhabditis nigoni]|uniref:BTB domain-containing protein n=1 Tax=Caenorhabditis nigoni TaxID=1611254 RepID=A0A2G5VC75_9PELO|nr:hypothetical protein B9Z55_007937 [Caenorhabditis nigoni]